MTQVFFFNPRQFLFNDTYPQHTNFQTNFDPVPVIRSIGQGPLFVNMRKQFFAVTAVAASYRDNITLPASNLPNLPNLDQANFGGKFLDFFVNVHEVI
jgi:hypothetical protein